MRLLHVGVATVLTAVATTAAAQRRDTRPPDVLLVGGKVFTADSTRPWAEAIAIRGDRIVATGSTKELRSLAKD